MIVRPVRSSRPTVVVAGGGVGGVEAVLALRALAGDVIDIELVTPDEAFVYRAMSVAEPFGHARSAEVPLARLARDRHVVHHRTTVTGVEPAHRHVRLADGRMLRYDALVLAVGAEARSWLPRALTFSGPGSTDDVRALLERLREGTVDRVLFAGAPGTSWTLPLYELALLTSSWVADEGVTEAQLSVATTESGPLWAFGPAASRAVADLLADRGVKLHRAAQVTAYDGNRARLSCGDTVDADAVVTLPRLSGRRLPGVPADRDGFVPVDRYGAVSGLSDVYAVGDNTIHPFKQGGLAAQQADAAAATIAARLGLPVGPEAFRPTLRGLLLTGVTAAYLRSTPEDDGEIAFDALWWPPAKVAGRFLGPYLAGLPAVAGAPELADRSSAHDTDEQERAELRRLAVEMAEADAAAGDTWSALRWLKTVEWLDGTLPPELAELRDRWSATATAR